MEFGRFDGELASLDADLLAVGVHKGASWTEEGPAQQLNDALGGLLGTVADEEHFEGKDGQKLRLHTHGRIGASRVLLVGLGDPSPTDGRDLAARAVRTAHSLKLKSVGVIAPAGESSTTAALVIGATLGGYSYDRWKTQDPKPLTVERVDLVGATGTVSAAQAKAAAEAVCFARDLVNDPPQALTPVRMAEHAQAIADEHGLECTILDKAAIEAKGMRLIMAVAAGSSEEPRFIHLTYRPEGATDETPSVALVGKGLTFDAGGLCLKPPGSIEDMKMDMGGGAAVLGAMKAVSVVAPAVVVHGIVPSSENMLGAAAYKPGDVFRSYNGKTVEILNTDAEGRLILADALSYAAELEPAETIDLATLTGAICVALGNDTVGLFGNDDGILSALKVAAASAGEPLWHMPLDHKLKEQLKSPVADLKNVGKRWGGAITAALFLHEFIGENTKWAHMDIAGPAFAEKTRDHVTRGGTGVGVLTLLEYLRGAGERLASSS